MENLLLPSQIEFLPGEDPNIGSLVVTPCYHGYGTTLGNSLRRVLLSSLPGAAVEGFKIKGVQHEFSSITGVQEDVVEIMLNLKRLTVKVFADDPVVLKLSKKTIGPITAGDIEKDSNVEIINPDEIIATLTEKKDFEMEIIVGRGRGFKPAEEKDRKNYDLGTILIDSVYTPIKDVGYKVDYTRVGDITNYEKLVLNVETDGTITPEEAVLNSTRILTEHYNLVIEHLGGSQKEEILSKETVEEEVKEKKTAKKKTTKKK